MYDTVNLWLGRDAVSNTDLLAVTPYLLTDICNEGINNKTGISYVSGRLDSYRVTVSDIGLSLKGSLPKYYLGDNLQTLTRQDTQRAFEKLSDSLHLPFSLANVYRLDIANNLLLDYKPEMYFPYLGTAPYYKRFLQPTSLYYTNGLRQLVFYDKVKETKKKNSEIPPIWLGCNVLRYEVRFLKSLSKQFKVDIKGVSLFNESFYIKVVKRWQNEFLKISKKQSLNLNTSSLNKPKDVLNQILAKALIELGEPRFFELVDELKEKNVFPHDRYYSRTKAMFREICKNPAYTTDSKLVLELEKKVANAGRHFR